MTTEITWTKAGIIEWMTENKVLESKTPSERRKLDDYFTEEASKHQETSKDRKLYRKATKLVQGGMNQKQHNIFMELEE